MLAGCAEPFDPPPFPIAERRMFRLTGRDGPDRGADGPPFEGSRALWSACEGATPCVAEQWQPVEADPSPDPRDPVPDRLTLLRRGDRLEPAEVAGPWLARWRSLAGVAALCVEDPLAVPPAGDPEGWRALVYDPEVSPVRGPDDPRWRWEVNLSGANRCALSGTLRLDATADHSDARGLLCGGEPWTAGGSECAREHLQQALALEARESWDRLDRAEQEAILAMLSQDPRARELTEELKARLSAR